MSDDHMPPAHRAQKNARLTMEREAQILDAAAELFAKKGFHRTTTRDIAYAAEVSEGTLYNYFKNKDAMLIGIIDRLEESREVAEKLATTKDDPPYQTLASILDERQRILGEHREGLQAVLSEILVDPELRTKYYNQEVKPFLDRLEDHFRYRTEKKEYQLEEPEVAARLLQAMMTGLFLLNVLGDPLVCEHWNDMDEKMVEVFYKAYGNST